MDVICAVTHIRRLCCQSYCNFFGPVTPKATLSTMRGKSLPRIDKHCECFDSDNFNFYTRSFVKPSRGKVQFFDKKDGEIFIRESRPKKKSWMPRSTSNVDFIDPLHKAALCFYCYLNENDGEEGELLKIRPMKLTYHLDDEVFSMNEPYINNSGYVQGRVFYRQRVPRAKDSEVVGSDYLSWKDIRIGEDITMFGRRYRVVSCDNFTKNFYQDRGIEMRETGEEIPVDAWNLGRRFGKIHLNTGEADGRQVLTKNDDEDYGQLPSWETIPSNMVFHVAWLDTQNDFHASRLKRIFRMLANKNDDTVTLTEMTPGFNNALFLRNVQLPYYTRDGRLRHHRVCHMRPGCWINVFKRPMFIYDCEGDQTVNFVRQQYSDVRFGHCPIEVLQRGPPPELFHLRPTQLLFYAENQEFPGSRFLLIFNYNTRRIDIFEAGRLRAWTKARPFLIDVDASHIDGNRLSTGSQVTLFRWTFCLTEAHPQTKEYLDALQFVDK